MEKSKNSTNFSLHTWFVSHWHILFGLAILICVIYANSLQNEFISDDIPYLVQNPNLHSFQFVLETPFTIVKALVNWLTFQSFGLHPLPFHIVNILFHIGSAWITLLLLSILIGPPAAVSAVFLWSLHPILTESVTWIGGGGYVMYGFFFLVSLVAYILKGQYRWGYVTSLVLYVLMLGTSEKSIPLSLVFIVYESVYGNIRKNWKILLPYIILTNIWVILVFGYTQQRIASLQSDYYMTPGFDNPFVQIPITTVSYMQLLLWPEKLTFYHSTFVYTPLETMWIIVIALIVFGSLIVSFFRNKFIFFCLSLFFISLSPSLTPFRISWWVAERYVYLGSLGIIAALCYVLVHSIKAKQSRFVFYILLSVCAIALMVRTMLRNADWRSADTFWTATAETSPLSAKSHNNLGDVYVRSKNFIKANAEFRLATELQPNYADAYHNLAVTSIHLGKTDVAIENLKKALAINPNIWQSHLLLAELYYQKKLYAEALEHTNAALLLKPDEPYTLKLQNLLRNAQ